MLKTMALLFGIVFLLVGAGGFFMLNPAGPGSTGHDLTMHSYEGMLLGIFPVNMLHSAVHLLFGVIGLVAARSVGAARGYFKFIFIAYALLAILGLIPATMSLFGLVPLGGNDVYLHAALAIVGGYLGFVHKETTVVS